MEKVLIVITGRVINVLHVGGIQLEHAETDVEFGVWRVKSGVVICQLLFQNFFSCSSDSLFSDFADGLVARFVGFACFIALFGKLYHDEFAVSAVFGIDLHNCVSGGGGAGEEVEDDTVFRTIQ